MGRLLAFIVVVGLIGVLIEVLGYSLGKVERVDKEKMTSYECGYEAIESNKEMHEVRFYIVGLLFIVLDIEGSYVYP